jgi:GTPase SAR1 family protein
MKNVIEIAIVGAVGSGKTSIMKRIKENKYN